jgi:alkanesulfonate monooxygenase SsuD/methylene tetrahydromethanopterin reductase-like flavin-dependent oxidoreductase (luciferase family)
VKRILFDHCVPKPLRRQLADCEVRTCFERGWAKLRNGELLTTAEAAGFDIFLTADKSLRYQQNLSTRKIAIIELPTNRLSMLPSLVPALLAAPARATPGSYERIDSLRN